jgi:BirA family biotin operon repressor/biotin-[acetyl-CoA-carboxylase] ligase
MAGKGRRDSGLTSFQIPGGRTVLIDNRIGVAPADATILSLARRGAEESYTVISDFLSTDEPDDRGGVPRLHICILLRPGKRADYAGIIGAMGTLAASHAIERNSDYKTSIRWLGSIYAERRRIGAVSSESMLLPSGYLDYLILHAQIDMPPSRFPTRMTDVVTRIFTSRRITNADHIAQAMIHDFFTMYDAMNRDGTQNIPFWEEYRRRSYLLGRRVRVLVGGKKRYGTATAIDPDGRLRVVLRDGSAATLSSQSQLLSKH